MPYYGEDTSNGRLTSEDLQLNSDNSATYEFGGVFQNRTAALNYCNYLRGFGYNMHVTPQNGVFIVSGQVGYNDNTQNPGSAEQEPDSVWSIDPNYEEKPLLESGCDLVKNISVAGREQIQQAVKNPGKGIKPWANTSEMVNGKRTLDIMNMGVTGIPFATLTINKTVRVSRKYASDWTWKDVNNTEVMSKGTFVSRYQVPSWVEVIIPSTFTETLIAGTSPIQGHWAYREVRGSYNEAPNNQFSLSQKFVYDRWLADIYTMV